jgi:dCMP deaminase
VVIRRTKTEFDVVYVSDWVAEDDFPALDSLDPLDAPGDLPSQL